MKYHEKGIKIIADFINNLGIKLKLILLFVLIKIIPLIIVTVMAIQGVRTIGTFFVADSEKIIVKSNDIVVNTANIAVEDSIKSLDKKSQHNVEKLTRQIAKEVADFLYQRDKDILFLASTGLSPAVYRAFFYNKKKPVTIPPEYSYDEEKARWVPREELATTRPVTAGLEDNRREHHSNPKLFIKTEELPLYKEITYFDTLGNEQFKISSIDNRLKNISTKKGTYLNAEDYFVHSKNLQKGEIYVSSVIGEYVKSSIIGTYTRKKTEAAGIPFNPEESGYAGWENPVGKKFTGIIRFVTPIYSGGVKSGYISLALDHIHLAEYTDYVEPAEEGIYKDISDASIGNYAFMWDYKGRCVSHPRDYFIVGYDKETGKPVAPWVSARLYSKWKDSGIDDMYDFLADYPIHDNQTLEKKPSVDQIKAGTIALDGRYLNFAPQCYGWHNITRYGGDGSFIIFWSNVWKLTTVASIPYFTGQYGSTKRGFGYVTIGANVDEFHSAANKTRDNVQSIIKEQTAKIDETIKNTKQTMMSKIYGTTNYIIVTGLVMMIILIGAAILVSNSITKPVKELMIGARKITHNELDYRIPVRSNDEIGLLSQEFNVMADNLSSSFTLISKKNEDLKKLDKIKDEFLANTSHELRTPLNGIIGIAESLIQGAAGELSGETKSNLAMISASGKRLAGLVNDILDFEKLKNKEIKLQIKNVGLFQVVDIVFMISAPLVVNKELELVNNVDPALPLLRSDEDRLQQILINLVGNAIKFTSRGSITVSASLENVGEEKMVAIAVTDTGIGIPPEKHEVIFQSFEQADSSISREYGGTGIGLNISKKLVELQGGTIRVESEEGQGAAFIFTIPASDASPEEAVDNKNTLPDKIKEYYEYSRDEESREQQELENSNFDVLIVDDEPINLQVLSNNLSLENYSIRQSLDGKSALEAVEQKKPDLIILDVMMPRMSGYEVCRVLRQNFDPSQLPIILVTAKNQVQDLIEGFNVGANDYITKPFLKDELMARIKTHIELSQINIAYSYFVPHEYLQLLEKDSVMDLKLGDNKLLDMSVMFSDIRAFTSISEHMTPEDNFKFLNSYLTLMEPIVTNHGGFIDKYIGDAIMAIFKGGVEDAIDTGIDMLRELRAYNEGRSRAGYVPIQIGVGINSGPVRIGIIGGPGRMEETVISDTVNLASRIETMTKEYNANLLIGENSYRQIKNQDKYNIRVIDYSKPKGKTEFVKIYEIFNNDPEEIRAKKLEYNSNFEKGVALFFAHENDLAMKIFSECQQINPDDPIVNIYLERCHDVMIRGVL